MSSRYLTKNDRGNLLNQLVLIDEVELLSDTANIAFYDIPDTYKDLVITGELRTNFTGGSDDPVYVRVGDGTVDTGATYDSIITYINQGGTSSGARTTSSANAYAGWVTSNTSITDFYAPFKFEVLDYASIGKFRTMHGLNTAMVSTTQGFNFQSSVTWRNSSSPINTIQFRPGNGTLFKAKSKLAIYGRGLKDGATVQEQLQPVPGLAWKTVWSPQTLADISTSGTWTEPTPGVFQSTTTECYLYKDLPNTVNSGMHQRLTADFRVTTGPGTEPVFFMFLMHGAGFPGAGGFQLRILGNGALQLENRLNANYATIGTTFTTNTWYSVEHTYNGLIGGAEFNGAKANALHSYSGVVPRRALLKASETTAQTVQIRNIKLQTLIYNEEL